MDIIYPCCAGFDVHQETVVVALRDNRHGGRARTTTRTFATTTTALEGLRDWLLAEGVGAIAMESTGVYWKPIFNVLEEHFEALFLCNAQHLKRVPGRKTDVSDAEWIARLLQAGLLKPSFVPDRKMRELRDLNRERVQLEGEATRVVNRIHKVLQDANIKLATFVSDIMGVSGRAMLDTIASGEYCAPETAKLARGRMRSKIPDLGEALRGHVTSHHRFMIVRFLHRYDQIRAEVATFDGRIAALMSTESGGEPPPDPGSPRVDAEQEPAGLSYDTAVELLDTIHGINRRTAERILAEIGTDMTRFATASHLASWAGACPGSAMSAGKSTGGPKKRKGNRWLASALNQVAWAASRTKDSYFAAAFRRWSSRRGIKRAIVAVGHAILRTIWFVLSHRVPYADLGADWFDNLKPERAVRSLTKRLRKLGYEVVPLTTAPESAM